METMEPIKSRFILIYRQINQGFFIYQLIDSQYNRYGMCPFGN